jgi:hypothetical protein
MEASGTGNMKLALERRADHRHARRRQRRDARACRSREHRHLRPDGRGSGRSAAPWRRRSARRSRLLASARRRSSTRFRPRRLLAGRAVALSRPRSKTLRHHDRLHGLRRFRMPIGPLNAASTRFGSIRRAGGRRACSIPRAWAGSRRTARSASTRMIFGESRTDHDRRSGGHGDRSSGRAVDP